MTTTEQTRIGLARRWLANALEAIALAGFLVMCVSVILQVVFRYVLQLIAPWTEELARYACIWSVFLGAAVCFEERTHIKIDFIVDKVSGKVARRLLRLVDILVTSTFVLVALYGSILLVQIGWTDTATTIPIQMGLVYLALPVSMGAIAILGALRLAAIGGTRDAAEATR